MSTLSMYQFNNIFTHYIMNMYEPNTISNPVESQTFTFWKLDLYQEMDWLIECSESEQLESRNSQQFDLTNQHNDTTSPTSSKAKANYGNETFLAHESIVDKLRSKFEFDFPQESMAPGVLSTNSPSHENVIDLKTFFKLLHLFYKRNFSAEVNRFRQTVKQIKTIKQKSSLGGATNGSVSFILRKEVGLFLGIWFFIK